MKKSSKYQEYDLNFKNSLIIYLRLQILNKSNEIRLCIYCNDKVNHLTIRQDETFGDLKQKIRSKGFQNHNINYGTNSLKILSDSTSIIDWDFENGAVIHLTQNFNGG